MLTNIYSHMILCLTWGKNSIEILSATSFFFGEEHTIFFPYVGTINKHLPF